MATNLNLQIPSMTSVKYRYQNSTSEGTGKSVFRYFSQAVTKPPRRHKPEGWLTPLPYKLELTEAIYPHGIQTFRHKSYAEYVTASGCFGPAVTGFPYPPGPRWANFYGPNNHGPYGWVNPQSFGPNLKARAEIQAYQKLKEQKVNLSVMAAEARKTASMMGDVGMTLARAAIAVRKGRFRQAARILRTDVPRQPGNWLEWRYGWVPFCSELYGSIDALASSRINPVGWMQSVKGVVWEPITHREVKSGTLSVEHTSKGRMGAFVRLDVEPTNSFLQTLGSVGVINPLDLAWELLPYSFVVDWFLPIGDWLNVLDAHAGYRFKSGSCTIKEELEGRGELRPGLGGSSETWIQDGPCYASGHWCRRVFLERTVYTSFPLPRLPRPRLGINLTRFADAMSLLSQALKR